MRMKISPIFMFLWIVVLSADLAWGQECGPGCPACSGKATGDLLPPGTFFGSALYIPDGEDESRVVRLRYGVFSWMDVGIGYGLDEEETIWSVRVQPIKQDQDGWRPALIIGTGSVQTGGNDQSAYVQLAKTIAIVEGRMEMSLAAGYATDLPDLEEDWFLGTVSMLLFDKVSPFYSYDGINSHAGLSFSATDWLSLTAYALEMEELALSAGVQWRFGKDR